MPHQSLKFMPPLPIYSELLTVSQLNARARLLLEDVFQHVRVEGELSNLARPASGHLYFTLKDSHAQIRCVVFKPLALAHRTLKEGQKLQVAGRISLFEGRGDYQLILEALEPMGAGALRQAFETLKERLAAEGLFAHSHKKTLPKYPSRVGILTSPTGAVLQDMRSVFRRRAPHIELTLIATPVQGQDAIPQIIRALHQADTQGFDALILARGGGSLEDLWCFNDESVARALAACITPTISAIGHETDVSICDFAADVRAPTPSAAAELLAPDQQELRRQLEQYEYRLTQGILSHLQQRQRQLQQLSHHLAATQCSYLSPFQITLKQLRQRLHTAMHQQLGRRQHAVHQLAEKLNAISPLATLGRGYSILRNHHGQIIRSTTQVEKGQTLQVQLHQGTLQLIVHSKS